MEKQINYHTMRFIVGVIALFLAGVVGLLSNTEEPLTSMSQSYWTDAGGIFVGSLAVIGFFLAAYHGEDTPWCWLTTPLRCRESLLSRIAGVAAVAVGLFPTADVSVKPRPSPAWAEAVSGWVGLTASQVHSLAALILFLCLIFLLWVFAGRAWGKGHPLRAGVYAFFSVAMILGIAAGILIKFWLDHRLSGSWVNFAEWLAGIISDVLEMLHHPNRNPIFLLEQWALAWFGIAWFYAGSYPVLCGWASKLRRDKPRAELS